MKLSRRLRSFGAMLVCAAMILCNVPLVRAQQRVEVPSSAITGPVYGNGTGALRNRSGDPVWPIGGVRSDGASPTGNPNGNTVIIRNAIVDNEVYGAWAESGNVTNNEVIIRGDYPGATVHDVYGGYTGLGRSLNNEVTIENNSRVLGNVFGGYAEAINFSSQQGTTDSNVVNIKSGANIDGDVYGGRSGSASDNVVNIEGGIITGTIVGGGSDSTDALYSRYNEVNISGDETDIVGDIYGGLITIADTLENKVDITGGTLSGNVYGAVTIMGNSTGNTVAIEGTFVNGGNEIVGGEVRSQGNALENKVSITNSRFINNSGYIQGGYTNIGNANDNEVYVDGGEVSVENVVGGFSGFGNANGNNIVIGETGGRFNISSIVGGASVNGSANDNTVTIYRGTFTNVYGGQADSNGYANNNTVNLHGGTFNYDVIGGVGASGANGNTINIFPGNYIFPDEMWIFGGKSTSNSRDVRSGNTLNIWQPVTISGIENFEKYNFYLPANFAANDTMIAVTDGNGSKEAINLEGTKIEIGVYQGSKLKQGDTVILIDEQSGLGVVGNPANNVSDGSTLELEHQRGLVKYRFDLNVTESQLQAIVSDASPDLKTVHRGFLRGLILANQGADAIAGSAMDSAMAAAHKGPVKGLGGFGSLVVGKSEYDTGVGVDDMFGVSAAAGLAIGADFTNSILTMGPFFEYGKAEFDTTYNQADGRRVIDDGDSEYMGGGFLLRMDYKDTGAGRYFAEASVRAGRQKNNFSVSTEEYDPSCECYRPIKFPYSSSPTYYGAHAGYGGSWDVASSAALDIYGKYFFARGSSSNVSLLDSGENFSFDESVSSNRIRGGSRLAYVPGDSLILSFGGAYEYEMSGETIAPSLKGGTGIGEVVVGYKPSADKLTSINIGVQGYTGKRQGVTASVFFRF